MRLFGNRQFDYLLSFESTEQVQFEAYLSIVSMFPNVLRLGV
jgi:hypothetical protein